MAAVLALGPPSVCISAVSVRQASSVEASCSARGLCSGGGAVALGREAHGQSEGRGEACALAMSFLPSAVGNDWWRKPPSQQAGLFGRPGSELDWRQPDFDLACPQREGAEGGERERRGEVEGAVLAGEGGRGECRGGEANAGVPVYVMLPLDSVGPGRTVSRPRAVMASLVALKSAGVEGVMMDIWWGIVERDGPRLYRWEAYRELVGMARDAGLKVQAVMSFHQCGGNVGDHCFIPLPPWVQEEMDKNPDIAFTDRGGGRNREYVSLGCDEEAVLRGRTPVEVYKDFMCSFRNSFEEFLGSVITEIQVGMGPAGELRYPSYPESNDRWRFPGIGEFQCYDKYMLRNLRQAAERVGMPLWGLGGPHDSGYYKQWPEETGFFHTNGSWNSQYGDFFLQWYSGMLLEHGERLLSAARAAFHQCRVHISGKVAGIHWHYWTHSHAPELTAGYYNTVYRDGYQPLAQLFAKHGATLNFTCFEMRDQEQPMWAGCSPEGLLRQVVEAAKKAGVRISGENALPRYDTTSHDQIIRQSRLQGEGMNADKPMATFTFLRMNERLFWPENWTNFVFFVRQMREGRTFQPWEEEHHHSHVHIRSIGALSQAAAELMVR